jgi:hypothetical protein
MLFSSKKKHFYLIFLTQFFFSVSLLKRSGAEEQNVLARVSEEEAEAVWRGRAGRQEVEQPADVAAADAVRLAVSRD